MTDDPDDKASLSYTQVEVLENEGKKYTGNHAEQWVDNKSLCTSCRSAHIIRRGSQNRRAIWCNGLSQWMPEDIQQCNEYRKFTDLSLHQMSELATLIGGVKERKVGFKND